MHLFQLDLGIAALPHPVVDEEHEVAEVVELRPLPAFGEILERERVEGESLAQRRHLVRAGVGQVQPEVLVALQQPGDLVAVDAVEEAHASKLDPAPDDLGLPFAARLPPILLRSSALEPVVTGKVCV